MFFLVLPRARQALPHRKPASAGTSRDNCRGQGNKERQEPCRILNH